jgi:hypothetical protein
MEDTEDAMTFWDFIERHPADVVLFVVFFGPPVAYWVEDLVRARRAK